MSFFGILLRSAGVWLATVILSFVILLITAKLTEKLGSAKMQIVAGILIVVIMILFAASIWIVHSMGKQMPAHGWMFTLVYGIGSLLTVLMIGFVTLVALNR